MERRRRTSDRRVHKIKDPSRSSFRGHSKKWVATWMGKDVNLQLTDFEIRLALHVEYRLRSGVVSAAKVNDGSGATNVADSRRFRGAVL